jgi:hypothetical protein
MNRADVDACTRQEAERTQHFMIGKRICDGGARVLEEQKEAVSPVDFPTIVRQKQIACETVMLGPHPCCSAVAEPCDQLGAVDDVGEEQRL